MFSGGPASVYGEGAPSVDAGIFDLGIPILGICYGMQLIAHQLNGKVERAHTREYGKADLEFSNQSPLVKGLEAKQTVWMSHGDHVSVLPEGFVVEASTESLPIAAMSNRDRKIHAVQFHPEVRHSVQGNEMIHNFIYEVCGCVGDWTMSSFVEDMIKELRAEVGDKSALRTKRRCRFLRCCDLAS